MLKLLLLCKKITAVMWANFKQISSTDFFSFKASGMLRPHN